MSNILLNMRRHITTFLLLLLSSVINMAWGADIKYHIINNQGKECFLYVIKDNLSYESKTTAGFDYKTELCVHPWARSVVATNFRFYINREDAVADANGTLGAYLNEGDVISEVAPGKTEFYVRYSMKSADELAAAGFTYDPDGNMTYLIQIRERNAKGGKRRQVHYDTADGRFEFGNPGEKNKDIPSFESSESFKLQTDLQYRFRVKSGDDPYNTYFYNGAGEGQNANGVMTVSGISRDDKNKAKERVSYETKIDNYDPETTTSLQTFFFVAANEHILQSSWSEQYIGKMFVVGAVGGKEYWMRDVGSENATGGVESYVPYMLVANGSTGTFKDPGFQLQCYQSWRNYDYSNDNTSLALFTPYENTHEVTYHIVNSATHKDAMTIIQRHGPHSPFNLSNRDKLQRIGCTLSTDYYSDRECTTLSSGLVGTATDVYIPYTFNSTDDERAELSPTNVVFSTLDNPTWLSLTIRESGTKKLVYDATNNVIQSNTNSTATPDATTLAQQTAQFAFIGDPYSFQVICKAVDGQYAFADGENSFSYGNSKVLNNVRFADNPDESISSWAMIAGERSGSFQIFLRDNYALAFRAFWDAQGGGNQIRLYSRTATPEVHGDANLHATLTPTYDYTYNIVDNSGRIAIKYTVTQELSRRLDGEHGHKAIPSAIYSPYLEGETLTFYTTFTTPGDLSSLSGIEQLPVGGTVGGGSPLNIYVRYTQGLLSTRPYPLDDSKSYFMQLGDKYVIYSSGVATQDTRPSVEDADKDNKIWTVSNRDPYDVRVTNSTNSQSLYDNSECHLIIMSSTADSPAEGQVVLLLANQDDLATPSNAWSIALSGNNVAKGQTDRSAAEQQVIFSEAVLERTYRLIDKQGKILLEYSSNDLGGDKDKLGVPAEWRSPLIKYKPVTSSSDYVKDSNGEYSGYKYWKRDNFNISGNTYTLKTKTEQTPINGPAQSTDSYIYVTYDAITDASDANYVDMNSSFKDMDERVKRSPTVSSMDRDASKFGQMYMLKFTTSEAYRFEDGNNGVESAATASDHIVYPYTNGDGPLYINPEERWTKESSGGGSTRTRWAWYVVSPNNDPYHIRLTSWQTTHSRNNVSYYGYMRTYYNTEISQVITTNTSDDPTTVDTNGDRIMPTEYMLLGTKDNYLLVTSEEIGSDNAGYETTNHRVVNSLEQYWRNNPTVHRALGLADGSGPITAAQEETLKSTYGWHKYKAWVNAAAWSGGTGSSNKSYAYDDHWFMSIEVGTGKFELVPTEIDAVLVLLDNHGWEIMRQPIPKHSETDRYEATKDILRKWDSPMVKQYHFYGSRYVNHKVTGYHKYNIYDDYSADDGLWLKATDMVGSGTSLADYPEKFSGSALYDLYVTYEVKPEYAKAYTGAATVGATNVNYPFLIRQNGNLAQATDATTLGSVPAADKGIDTGSPTGIDPDDNADLYWYLKPNFEIDTEMGYQYDIHEDKDDPTSHVYTKDETNERYENEGKSGFDPYNIQIYNKQYTSGFFTTNATAAAIENGQYMKTTTPAGDGAVSLSAKVGTEGKFESNVATYDGTKLKITNQTFMAVQDANGNMRLMPRFDQNHVIENFTTLKDLAGKQPESDKSHGQSTWLLRPTVYTYKVIDNLGREALQYKSLSSGSPLIPAIFKSPLAKDFKFYATYTTPGTVSSLTNEITGSFADATGITENTVYVRYSYDPDSDTDELLQGMWYNAKLNGSDVKVTTEGVKVKASDSDDLYWRFMESAGDDSDPYAVTLWNGTPAKESDKRYIIMHHFDGTNTADYALMQAGTGNTTYSFLDYNSGTPTITTQSNYSSDGIIANAQKLTLTPVLKTNSVTYKIITHSGKVALTEENVAVSDESVLKLPEWMETPLMESDAYIFYSAATLTDGKYTVKGYPTTSPKSLDGNVVYVRYDYEKSKKAIESFGMPNLDGLPYNYSPLDLTGNVKYTIGITSNNNGRIWSVNTSTLGITEADVAVNTNMTRVARLWQFTGDDPYEVTIQNPSYSTTKVLAGKEPDSSASDSATPNDKYPLVKMMDPNNPIDPIDNSVYSLNTFMVLKYNPKEISGKVANVDHYPGTLKFYVTGNDHLYMAQSNSLAGGVYIYKDASSYKERLAASGEPINPKNNTMIIYSSFFYRPVLTYHVITNDGKEALTGYSQMAGTTVEMPQMYQSPLLNPGDFSYYGAATEEDGKWTVTSSSKIANDAAIATAAAQNYGNIYVRYTYSRANSPFKIATNIDDAAEDGTQLLWDNEEGLDLSGDTSKPNQGGTWYTIANFQSRWRDNEDHGNLFGIPTDYSDYDPKFEKAIVKTLANGRAPSNKRYLWKLMGNDPYAIRIYNADRNKYLSVATSDRKMSLQDKEAANYYQTFMLLEAHANDNEIGDYGRDDEGNYKYQLQRWTSLIATGTQFFTPVTTNTNNKASLSARDTWDFNNYNFSNYAIRMSSSEVVTRQILNMGGGGTTQYCIEFVKAPVTRKYHFHAVNQATGTVTWDAVLEHDWLQPLVLDDNIARQFCKYEKRNTAAPGDNVTGTGEFQTRTALEAEGQPNAQFYHDADFTVRVKDAGTNTYDVYPEIGLEDIYNIYFKYQIDNTTEVHGLKLSDITSTTEQIANDKAHYAETGRLDPAYYPAYNSGDNHGKWFFMVLDTDDAMSADGDEGSRTYTGNQYFLRREDNGTVNWMNNAYTLHPQAEDNYNDWAPSRVAEWYKKGDNDPYREGRWLWTFVGTDPYNMRIVNMESVVGVTTNAEGVYSLAGADNCWTTVGKTTLSNNAIAYPVTIPTEEPKENQYWGLSYGYGSEETFSLISTAHTTEIDGRDVNQPLYWNMQSRTINRVTTQSLEAVGRSSDRSNAIQLIPYEPVKYQDINLVIKRDDDVDAYKKWKAKQNWEGKTEYEIKNAKATQLKTYDSGISLLYFTAAERTYVAGDEIDLSTEFSLPINVRRAFCTYTLYSDDYVTPNGTYTVQDGPYPTTTQATEGGQLVYDEDGKPVYTYVEADGTTPAAGAQSIYVKYEVTSDIFLKTAPTKSEVATMAEKNDHVYFMDFPYKDSKGNAVAHHAFYDPEATTFMQTGDLSKNKDKNTGNWVPEKKSYSGSGYTSDTSDPYNTTQYRTADDRMVSTPEKLKWYFVGDPYKLQVFSTAGEWNTATMTDTKGHEWDIDTKAAQLARFNTVETNFKFVSDCVHIRMPEYTHIDNRENLIPTDESGVAMPEKAFPNRNRNKPYLNDFYWECVPAASSEAGTFALRFKEDNDLLGYRNVYYYLGRDGKTMIYNHSEENPQQYHINLNYRPNNERYESGKYLGYHKANNDSTIIRLVQPVKVYITTNRAADSRYKEQTNVTVDEYSGYYGLNETITGVPRHLQRKYVKYNDLTHNGVTSGTHSLKIGNATSSEDCSTHSSNVFVTGSKINPIFKFSVYYNVDDLTADGIHLFSSCETPSAPAPAELTWLDVLTGTNSWLYYDKTNVNGSGVEDQTSRVINYRRAMSDGKTGWNNSADGWTDGLKGLHWAFVGDPYDFTILNRRRYEDATINTEPMWFAAQKERINNFAGANDSIVWKALLVDNIGSYTTNTASGTAALGNDGINAHWSIQMAKTGDENNCFIRTASLDQTAANAAGTNNSDTDNYWRLMAKQRGTDEFFLDPYSLEDHNRYTNNKGNLNWGNYVTNDMRYSQTMNGLGVYEQRLLIRTAVAEDNDKADNDCFDAKVEIRTKDGTLRISKDKLEIKYGLAPDMLPYTLRRYGCEYTCYINYGSDDPEYPEIQLTRLRDSNTPMDDAESVTTATNEYNALSKAITAAKGLGKNVTLTYIYTVTDEVAEYFTTASDALTEDYTWTNGYFAWDQTYSGTNVEVEYYVDVFDHYVYDANGQIIDAVYIKERRTRVVSNPDQAYPTTAFLNTHTNQVNVFADESTQSKDDRQKWALVGDPYEFTLKNYAQYLINSNATQLIDNNLLTQTTIQALAQPFAMGIDEDGNTFLSVIDGTSREITSNISFDFSTSSTKTTKKVGSGTNTNDPTGNTYDTDDVKPFKLASLLSYADVVQYHLVIAHQHSLDHTDELTTDQGNTLNEHLLEYLMYQGIQKGNKDMYVNYTGNNPTSWKDSQEENIKTLLKQNASLRDFISYPVADYSVARVGIGNHPQVPWYMKRQFCRYFLYQKDVMRSVIDKVSPSIEVADADWGSSTVEIDGVEYKVNPSSPNAVKVVYYNGKFYLYEKASDEIKNAGTTYDGLVQRTFKQDGVVTKAFNIKWITIRDMSYWDKADAAGDGIVQVTSDDVAAWNPDGGTYEGDRKLVVDQYRKKPKYYDEAAALQGKVLDRLQECHYNRMVKIDVVYEVIPEAFQFAWRGRNTTAWYQMMTNNSADGLMNFTYSHGIGARQDRREHYTNNYLWAPEGDPYGFILRSRYATINGNGWDNVAVTTKGALPKKDNYDTYSETTILAENPQAYDAKYTDNTAFNDKRIIHVTTPTHGPSNAVYEMFTGDAGFTNSFLMHPTSAFIDTTDPNFTSYYMIHDTGSNISKLTNASARELQEDADANWTLRATAEQLLPYFERAGYVGGINPARATADFNYQDYYTTLRNAVTNGTSVDFSTLRKIQEKVYAGTFKDNAGNIVAEGSARPDQSLLPMTFEPDNLVNMKPGYYRIRAFSQRPLDIDGNDMSGTGFKGVTGPRYISGYRFKSEMVDNPSYPTQGGRWLHFFETDMEHSDIHTYADLKKKISDVNAAVESSDKSDAEKAALEDRDEFDHKAMAGNIEILPADFDPSSIFYFTEVSAENNQSQNYTRYNISTQGLQLRARPGGKQADAGTIDAACGHTELVNSGDVLKTNYDNRFRLSDVGGAAVTLNTIETLVGTGGKTWDEVVGDNLKTNYVCIDGHHRYRITCHKDNEMVEIGEHHDTDGSINGIQDTKWLLQPVGIHEEWPYNEMPLRVEVQKGGVKNRDLTGGDLTAESNKDTNYYGTLYVPFDTRLGNTTDAAFTLTTDPTEWGTTTTPSRVTMSSVSRLNEMGNPQFIPAAWPVVIRSGNPGTASLKNQDNTNYATRHYVNMYIPNVTPTVIPSALSEITLKGQYLEQKLTSAELDTKTIMVFGLPFEGGSSHTSHEYNENEQVGWFTNDNWAREDASGYIAHTGSYPSTATVADHSQRSNKYVYHNKVYYVLSSSYSGSAPSRFNVAIFDDEGIEEQPLFNEVTDDVPWPCDVYDPAGRKVASHETPATLLLNHPGLPKGVYIFGGRKMIIR